MLEFGTSRIRWLNVAQVRESIWSPTEFYLDKNDDSSRDMKVVGSLNLMWVGDHSRQATGWLMYFNLGNVKWSPITWLQSVHTHKSTSLQRTFLKCSRTDRYIIVYVVKGANPISYTQMNKSQQLRVKHS